MKTTTNLRQLVQADPMVLAPFTLNVMHAKIAEAVGFPAVSMAGTTAGLERTPAQDLAPERSRGGGPVLTRNSRPSCWAICADPSRSPRGWFAQGSHAGRGW
jgi:hypothetical protein